MFFLVFLWGLLFFFGGAVGFFWFFQTATPPPQPEQEPEPVVRVPVVPPPVEPPQMEPPQVEPPQIAPVPEDDIVVVPPLDDTIIGSPDDTVVETPKDTVAALNQYMPGFVDLSVPNIDIDAKLALSIHELNLEQQSLIGFVRLMSSLTGIPITLDIDEMKARSLSVKTPVAGRFSETTAGEILTETLATLKLQWKATDRQILILPDETADEDLSFDVSDFTESPEILAEIIQKLVCPEATITVLPNNRLTVVSDEGNPKSPQRTKDDIVRFLEQLRVIRQLPQTTKLTGESLAPEAFGWDRVLEPITLHHYRAVPLSRAVAQLESLTKLTIIVDHQSLHRSLCSFASVQATVQCDLRTINDAIELLLSSVDTAALAYRIIDHQTLEITTAEAVRQPKKMVMEVHPYELRANETPEDVVRLLRSAISPESWEVTGLPETKYGGNIVVDESSKCLLIRQSQPVQRQIRLYLSEPEPLAP
jgi:hypothetical protein